MDSVHNNYVTEKIYLPSSFLKRTVVIDTYFPQRFPFGTKVELLLFNDGQLLLEMDFNTIINRFTKNNPKKHLLVAAIHAGEDRVMEYGTSSILNYKGQGAKASCYTQFIMRELIAFIYKRYPFISTSDISIAGFSLGALSALDIAWNNARSFKKVGMFSASFWWRNKALGKAYNDSTDRIMHTLIRNGKYHPQLRFYFECGTNDEEMDRNNNGIIDSIDDTEDLIRELLNKGYKAADIYYSLIENGQHNAETWGDAIPEFLLWGWSADAPLQKELKLESSYFPA